MTIDEIVHRADAVKGYMSLVELRWLAEHAAALHGPALWGEIGSWQGRSAYAVACALPAGSRLRLIDNFSGPTTREAPNRDACRQRLEATMAKMRVDAAPGLDVKLLVGDSAAYARNYNDQSFDAMFIDGDHAYAKVVADIVAWRPKIKSGGLICGHDFTNKCGVEPAVRTLIDRWALVPNTSIWYATVVHTSLAVRARPLSTFVSHLQKHVPFAFSRWGDGEWNALLGYTGATCDGQVYSSELRARLTDVLERRPSYWLGLQSLAQKVHGPAMIAWLARRRLSLSWIDADVLAQASRQDVLEPFLAALQGRDVVLVGPATLRSLSVISPKAFVEVSPKDAFADLVATSTRIQEALQGLIDPVVCLSAGPTAKLLVDAGVRARPDATWIDCGSLWEPYVGIVSRTYHQKVMEREGAAHE